MNAAVLEEVGKFQLRKIPKPVPGDGEVLIRVGAVGICGTDLHIFQGLLNLNLDSRGQPIPCGSSRKSWDTNSAELSRPSGGT